LFGALFLFAVGCSGTTGVTPDDRGTMDEFFSNLTYDDSIAGNFYVTDVDGEKIFESTLVRDEVGNLSLGETRTGNIIVDLTWLNLVTVDVDYLDPAGFTSDGRSIYYIGTNMCYDFNVIVYGNCIHNANVIAQQRYLGGPYNGQLMPGASEEEWLNQLLCNGPNIFNDCYYIPYGTCPGNAVTWGIVWFPFNFWCLHFEIILYNCPAGVWDP
jgi:hypothetical protein